MGDGRKSDGEKSTQGKTYSQGTTRQEMQGLKDQGGRTATNPRINEELTNELTYHYSFEPQPRSSSRFTLTYGDHKQVLIMVLVPVPFFRTMSRNLDCH